MTVSYFHSGCTVIVFPLCLDSEMLSAVAIKEHASVFYELKRFFWRFSMCGNAATLLHLDV